MQTQTWFDFHNRYNARINAGGTAEQAIDGALREGGALRAVRVSSAQASCPYAYWGAVRYHVRLRASGRGYTCVAIERASSDRRSVAGAERDAKTLADSEGRVWAPAIGAVDVQTLVRLAERGYP